MLERAGLIRTPWVEQPASAACEFRFRSVSEQIARYRLDEILEEYAGLGREDEEKHLSAESVRTIDPD